MKTLGAFLLAVSVSTGPADPQALLRAEKLLAKQDYKAAEAALREILRDDPASARAHGNLALALLAQKKVPDAVAEGRLAAAFGPQLPEARYIYGMALRAEGRPLEAAREFEQALALKPGQAGALRALAGVYAAQQDPRTAATYEQLILLEPDKPSHRAEFAEYLWAVGEAGDGNRVMAEALAAFPEDADFSLRFGRALFEQERYLDAAARLETAQRLGSKSSATAALLAESRWKAGKTEAALRVLAEAAQEAPYDPRLLSDRGRLLLSLGQADQAIPPLEALARLQPSDAATQLDLGRAYETVGRLADAERAYRAAVRLVPGSPRAHYVLGRLLTREGEKAEGEKELEVHRLIYDRAQKLVFASEHRSSETALAWAELNQGKATRALEILARLPESPDVLFARATALARLQRHREAVASLERAHQLDPEDHRIDLMLATARSRAEEP